MIPKELFVMSFPTGSRYICNPPVLDTDNDEMFLVYSLDETHDVLTKNGWARCGNSEYALDGKWAAYRKGFDNALITDDYDHYTKFEAATELAKKRNLLTKTSRCILFDIIVGQQLK